MPSKPKKSNKKAVKKPQKKSAVKTKKGKTVTFQAKSKTDPFAPQDHRPNSPTSNDPRVCECGDLDCPTTLKLQQYNELPPIIQKFAKELGEQMGAQGVMVVGIPLNPANPRTESPTKDEFKAMLETVLKRLN